MRVLTDLEGVTAEEWNALCDPDDPFVDHAFLRTLEASGSVGGDSGWTPAHITLREDGRLRAAMPLYVKTDSYGEYIFDWGWAQAAHRAGVAYYPKLVSAVPFTPAGGRRLLAADAASHQVLLAAVAELARETDSSSAHVLFCRAEEQALLAQHGYLPRLTYQLHWHNHDYGSFDDFLAALRAPSRKQLRRERRLAAETGLVLRTLAGAELTEAHTDAMYRFYLNTIEKKGAHAYLTAAFFAALRGPLSHLAVVTWAERPSGDAVAGALSFRKGRCIYGRYWGTLEQHDELHFELCYYRLIELAIAEGMVRVEAGAQGAHKLKRGFMPQPTYSAHSLAHRGLRRAVAEHLVLEASAVRAEMAQLAEHGPFRRAIDPGQGCS
jgi:predicted N-acyltransferase